MIALKRAYEPASADDGERVLVERLWPRGVAKEAARIDAWPRDLAPSPSLRKWYGHDPARWPEFRERYGAELDAPEQRERLTALAEKCRRTKVTFVYAARDTERNSATVLKEHIERLLR